MWVDPEPEVRMRMRDRMGEADRHRLAARPGVRHSLSRYRWRLRQAAGFGLVRSGLRLLDPGRVWP